MNFSGKLTAKIVIKDDYIRADGTCALLCKYFLMVKEKASAAYHQHLPILTKKSKE
jgi:hypothetical protein